MTPRPRHFAPEDNKVRRSPLPLISLSDPPPNFAGGAAATATKPTPTKTGSTAGGFDFNIFPATIKGHYRNDGPALG
jgi:hypothetical protein